jgi:hypothetical protein
MLKFKTGLLFAGAVMALVACEGGGGSGDAPAMQVDPLDGLPADATQSVSAWVGFLQRLIQATGTDQREGFGLSSNGVSSVPGDDAAEPAALQ